jgi:hypothetical protein
VPDPTPPAAPPSRRASRLGLALLGLGILVAVLLRVPLVLNAAAHMDSDLAVDGLTLAELLAGRIRLHFPGTPAIGTPPLLFSLPPALVWGATPTTLVGGAAALGVALIPAVYGLARRAFGAAVAAWSLPPLVFASTGVLWLSGRMTGGHLAASLWYAPALAGLAACLGRPSTRRWGVLGLACGFGLYLDRMTVFGTLGMGLAVLLRPRAATGGRPVPVALAVLLGAAIGFLPAAVGGRLDPHDAYGEQFVSVFEPIDPASRVAIDLHQAELLIHEHLRILLAECLPRLVAGYRLPGFETEPPPLRPRRGAAGSLPVATTLLALGLTGAGVLALLRTSWRGADGTARTIARAQVATAAMVLAAFVLNRNIYNSDNYRYLVLLLVPQAIGVGLFLRGLARRGGGGEAVALSLALGLAGLMTLSAARWEGGQGWLVGVTPVRRPVADPALAWLSRQDRVGRIEGDYWDVYRLAFLLPAHPSATPYPGQPERFGPTVARPVGRSYLVARPAGRGLDAIRAGIAAGAAEAYRGPGVVILERPRD